jgi:hypothetical protein
MNFPFWLPTVKELGLKKREDAMATAAQYERKLAEYKTTLENYKKYIEDNLGKQEPEERRPIEDQLSLVQIALDLTYLKEQGERFSEQVNELDKGKIAKISSDMEGLVTALVDTNYKLEEADKNVVRLLSERLAELQNQLVIQMNQNQTDLISRLESVEQKVKRNNVLLWFLFILQLLSLSGIVFVVLYIFGLLPF